MRLFHVSGTSGSGKTQLSMSLANRFSSNARFVSSELLADVAMERANTFNNSSIKSAQYIKSLDELTDESLAGVDCLVIDMIELLDGDRNVLKPLPENIKVLIVNKQLPRATGFKLEATEIFTNTKVHHVYIDM